MKVLIADDSEVVRKRLAEMISEVPGVEISGQAKDGKRRYVSSKK